MAAVRPVLKLTSTAPTGLSTIVFNSATHLGEFHLNYQFNQTNNDKSVIRLGGYPAGDILTMQVDGNVGIGANCPSQRLEVNGNVLTNAENSALGIDAQSNPRLGFIKKFGNGPVIASDNGNPIIFSQSNQTGIYTNISGATLTERMRIDANGNVRSASM